MDIRVCRILVVDDDAGVLGEIHRVLPRVTPFEVEVQQDPVAALERLRAIPYDVLVTGVQMSGLRGTQLAKAGQLVNPRLRVIFMTGMPLPPSDESRLSGWPIVAKPFSTASLVEAIRRVLVRPVFAEPSVPFQAPVN
jgi:DNA-binding NtrC family response regulator